MNSCFLPQKKVLLGGSRPSTKPWMGCWKGQWGLQGSLYVRTSVQMQVPLPFHSPVVRFGSFTLSSSRQKVLLAH